MMKSMVICERRIRVHNLVSHRRCMVTPPLCILLYTSTQIIVLPHSKARIPQSTMTVIFAYCLGLQESVQLISTSPQARSPW
ncbi:hypothetical protein BDW42DRAFT_161703 [Aspergillus taichungensis]|uniref:Uncharacterized protein n=1 Tax=Aspergillus taichungensis TaxID=482145 RepID=A0A2J5I4K9_9EURO|nr:hypothetical protein BDW42DRAFT_161703 [Aspergillus taichungensis]